MIKLNKYQVGISSFLLQVLLVTVPPLTMVRVTVPVLF